MNGRIYIQQEKLIWLILLVLACMTVSAVYYALTREQLPCSIVSGDTEILNQLRFQVNHHYLVSKLKQYINQNHTDTSKWRLVRAKYDKGSWYCTVNIESDNDPEPTIITINPNGTFKTSYILD